MTAPAAGPLDLLLVSQDRPERLARLLHRLRADRPGTSPPTALCRATAPDLAADYERVRGAHPGVRWIETDDAVAALGDVARHARAEATIALLSDADEPEAARSGDRRLTGATLRRIAGERDALALLVDEVARRAATPQASPCRIDGIPASGGAQAIPRVFHRIWLGDRPMPAEHEAFAATWLERHPGWELRTWTDATLPALRNQAAFDAAATPAQKADIARLEILLEHGGVYLDVDFECLRSIEPLLGGLAAFACAEDETAVTNAIMGCAPGHPFFRALVERLPHSIERYRDVNITYQSGPGLLTREVALEQALGGCAPWIFGPDVFYPYHWSEPHRRHERFPDAYGVHHWTMSWVDQPAAAAPQRFTIAPDWDAPWAAVAAARAYCGLFAPGEAVELAVTVPAAPGDEDAELVGALLATAAADPAAIPDVVVYEDAEAAGLPAAASLLAPADDPAAGCEVADLIAAMHAVRAALDGAAAAVAAQAPDRLRAGIEARRAHDREAATAGAPPDPPAPAAPVAPGVHGVYVGDGRMLVRTTWGGKLFASATDLSLTPDLVTEGVYDRPFTNYLLRTLRPGDTAIDVGANIGLFTLLMAQLVGAGGRVLAYEAQPGNAALLRDNLTMSYMDWATVVEKAAGEASGTLPFHAPRRFAGNGSLLPRDAADNDAVDLIDVLVEPLDVHAGRLARVDLLKIDVEGAEHRVLNGATRLLESGVVRRVAFELVRHHMGDDWAPFCAQLRGLRAAGWSFERLDADGTPFADDLERILEVGWFSQVIMRAPA